MMILTINKTFVHSKFEKVQICSKFNHLDFNLPHAKLNKSCTKLSILWSQLVDTIRFDFKMLSILSTSIGISSKLNIRIVFLRQVKTRTMVSISNLLVIFEN